MLEIRRRVNRFGSFAAVDGVALQDGRRESFTLLRLIAGFEAPDAGAFLLAAVHRPSSAVGVACSFNDSRRNAEWVGLGLARNGVLLRDDAMLLAARNSLWVAFRSATLPPIAPGWHRLAPGLRDGD